MPEILKADFELRKILINGQRTTEQELETDTLVLGNANLEIRVKGDPIYFKDFVPGSLLTIAFTQSQTTIENFDKAQEEAEEEQDEKAEEQQELSQSKGDLATLKETDDETDAETEEDETPDWEEPV